LANKKKHDHHSKQISGLPGREELLDYISKNPANSSKREIARAFKITGDDRMKLKASLRALKKEGLLDKSRGNFTKPGELPNVVVLDIVTRDRDGGLLAKPAEWPPRGSQNIDEDAPIVSIRRELGSGNGAKSSKVAGVGDRILARISRENSDMGKRYSARVIKILDSQPETVLGIFRAWQDGSNTGGGWIEPIERRSREMDVEPANSGDAEFGDLVEIQLLKSSKTGRQRVRIVNVLGSVNSEKAVSMIAIHANDIPYIFPDEVIEEANSAGPATMNSQGAKREDWRHLPLITIDPFDAKDHDDAIYAIADDAPNNEGGYRVTVAIADVSSYVHPNSALDREALKRGNSVYFPDRVVPMLPERISNELCSLKEKVDRPALAVEMVFSSKGKKLSHNFHRIMMRSHAKLSYQQAQAAIDGEKTSARAEQVLEDILKPLWAAYHCLLIEQKNRAPLALDLPERKIILKEDGTVDRVDVPPRLDAHRLVEEFMILANVAAAETLERKKQALIFRIHDAPSLSKLESLREFLKTAGLSLVKGGSLRPFHFNEILSKVEGKDTQQLINQVVLRSQSQAEYNPQNIGHFGLNLGRYAHFTSPIRRYADLIVHRALIGCLGLGKGGITRDEEERLDVIASSISDTERRAMKAERDTKDRLIAAHMSEQINATFAGRINGVTRSGLFVTLDETGADGFIPLSKLGNEYFIHDEAAHAVIGERSGLAFQMGDQVEVKLVEAAPMAGSLLFEMISEGRKSNALPRSRPTNTNRRGSGQRYSHKGPPRGSRSRGDRKKGK
jgi:ribonuclease R